LGEAIVPQIIAMGGGGFSMEPDNPRLDRYVVERARERMAERARERTVERVRGEARPRACFVPTASADSADYVARFHAAFRALGCETSILGLFKAPTADLEGFVREQDLIYVGGGNTRNLLALWREWGLDRIFRRAWEDGIVLAGLSAGSICWFEQGVTDSIPGSLTALTNGLGFLPGSHCPHYDGEAERRPAYRRLMEEGRLAEGWAADDGVALHFVGTRLERVVSSRPAARAYRVERLASGVVRESEHRPIYLD
jgi:peptidase E